MLDGNDDSLCLITKVLQYLDAIDSELSDNNQIYKYNSMIKK